MVSLDDNTSLSPTRGKLLYREEFENHSSSRKRKLEYSKQAHDQEVNSKKMFPSKNDNNDHDDDMSSIFNTPFPMDRQRCLDIKSGQIYFYNIRTQERTSKDSKTSPSKPPSHGRLDLELNLPCGSPNNPGKFFGDDSGKNSGGLARSPSWLNFEKGDNKEEEMVTTVCNKCHMLVMMFKSSPSCPNCKFTYPPHQIPPNIFNRTSKLSLLC